MKKSVYGKTTEYAYDATNQLVSSSCDGKETKYAYDAAGRMIKEGERSYAYGWLDKVMSVAENDKETAKFEYHNSGQIARAVRESNVETFEWDGLALIERSGTKYVNEPHAGGGNPVVSDSEVFFNDMLGSTLGAVNGKEYSAVDKTAFGVSNSGTNTFFTGKPYIADLGYAFLFRNYRADVGKWQTQDPLGYPDGWNNFAYCGNSVIAAIDLNGLSAGGSL